MPPVHSKNAKVAGKLALTDALTGVNHTEQTTEDLSAPQRTLVRQVTKNKVRPLPPNRHGISL